MDKTKEEIYDALISPLMAQIIQVCKEHRIAHVCSFSLDQDGGLCCTTMNLNRECDPPESFINAADILFPQERKPLMITIEKADGSKEIHAVMP